MSDDPAIYCQDCKNPCYEIVVDFGIGEYEFWGAPGYDSQEALVSHCCEAPVFLDETLTKPYHLSEYYRGRMDYD